MFGMKQFGDNDSESEKDSAFQEEAVPHLDALYGTALRMTKDEQDAEDLVQEAMLKAYRYFDKYENGTNCKAWLFKIMTNTFINKYRKSKKRKEYLVDDDYRPLQERAEAPERNPFVDDFEEDEENLYFKMFGDEVKEALEDIPVDFRMVVLLADLQDFAYKEIAEIMDCPIGTVMSRLYRGRRMLQSNLEEYARREGYISEGDEDVEDDQQEGSNMTKLEEYRRRRASG
ncbi:MAG: sigma-70 family RNA polymerase sigma factor [Persicimonas sp.]